MSDWKFNASHIASWAKFSGDFNPIHFDLERARRAGSDAIIVHGMLPLLHVKQAIARRHAQQGHGGRWLSLKCRLKSPLAQGSAYQFSVREAGDKGKFAVERIVDNTPMIHGTFSMAVPIDAHVETAKLSLERDAVCEKLGEFAHLFPTIDALWIALDGLAFSRFLSSEVPFEMAKGIGIVPNAKSQEELMAKALTMQTFHAVHVSPALLNKTISNHADITAIEIRLPTPTALKNGPSELIGSHELDIYINGQFGMRTEIGLMLKLN
jgi:hypothetical protein